MAHQPAQILSGQRPIGDDADAFRPVGDFPRFTDGDFGWKRLAIEAREIAPAPDALFEDGMEDQGVEGTHGNQSRNIPNRARKLKKNRLGRISISGHLDRRGPSFPSPRPSPPGAGD